MPSYLSYKTIPGSPTYQTFIDVDWLLEDCPHDCFIAVGGGQGSHVSVVLCEVYTPNQVINGKGTVYANFGICRKDETSFSGK